MSARGYFIMLVALCVVFGVDAQAQVRVKVQVGATGPIQSGSQTNALLTVEIASGWHISSLTQPEGGPARTEISIPAQNAFRIEGEITAPAPHKEFNALFDVDVETYTGTVTFTLPLVATENIKPGNRLTVEITYQACSAETCLMPKTETVAVIISPRGLDKKP